HDGSSTHIISHDDNLVEQDDLAEGDGNARAGGDDDDGDGATAAGVVLGILFFIVALVLLVIVSFLAFRAYRQYREVKKAADYQKDVERKIYESRQEVEENPTDTELTEIYTSDTESNL